MITIAPLDRFEIGGRALRVSDMTVARLQSCNEIGQAVRLGLYRDDLVPWAVATVIKAMVIDNHPQIRSAELVPHLTYLHFEQTANELCRQLLLSLPKDAMGKA